MNFHFDCDGGGSSDFEYVYAVMISPIGSSIGCRIYVKRKRAR